MMNEQNARSSIMRMAEKLKYNLFKVKIEIFIG